MLSYGDWSLDVSEVKGKMDRGELVPDPDWQRNYIWKAKDEELLIDSILKGLPIPKFYLTEEYDAEKGASIHYAVDGQQRLKAIHKFLSNEFAIEIEGAERLFKDLDHVTQKKITTYKLNGHYMRDYTEADVSFLFQRLNTTGIKLTNMEVWNSEYQLTPILNMIKEIYQEHKAYYEDAIYTKDNVARMVPIDDILDLCNSFTKNSVESGYKRELASFLMNYKGISQTKAAAMKSIFRKAFNNLREVLSSVDLASCAYRKRTHFLSLFLSVGLLVSRYYILAHPDQLKAGLLYFIENQPDEYRESVLGAIRQKAARVKRVNILTNVILKHAVELDTKRSFSKKLKDKFWSHHDRVCQLCQRPIQKYGDATLDHIIPWAKGGRTEESNAQLAHVKCNQKKRDQFDPFVVS